MTHKDIGQLFIKNENQTFGWHFQSDKIYPLRDKRIKNEYTIINNIFFFIKENQKGGICHHILLLFRTKIYSCYFPDEFFEDFKELK